MINSNFEDVIVEIASKFNGFLLTHQNGKAIMFYHQHELYHYVMIKVFNNCPKGYIELRYLISLLYPALSTSKIKNMLLHLEKDKIPSVVVLDYHAKECELYFEKLFISLHSFFNTTFDRQSFVYALSLAQNSLEMIEKYPK